MFIHGLFSYGGPQQNWLLVTPAAATEFLTEMAATRICPRIRPRGTMSQPSVGVVRAYSLPAREETPAGNRDNRYPGLMHNLQTKDRQSKKAQKAALTKSKARCQRQKAMLPEIIVRKVICISASQQFFP